jgi:hypothetical protein
MPKVTQFGYKCYANVGFKSDGITSSLAQDLGRLIYNLQMFGLYVEPLYLKS